MDQQQHSSALNGRLSEAHATSGRLDSATGQGMLMSRFEKSFEKQCAAPWIQMIRTLSLSAKNSVVFYLALDVVAIKLEIVAIIMVC